MKGKYIVPLILASVTATTFGAHAQFKVKADYSEQTLLEGDLIQVSGFEGEGEVGEKVYLPVATTADVKIVVTDPRGNKVTTGTETGKYFFVPTLKGYYTVKYEATTEGKVKTVTEELKVLVKGNDYSISLPTNSEHIIPATVKTNTEVKIPLPSVLEDGEEIDADALVSTAAKTGLKVSVANKDNSSETTELAYNSTSKTFNFTPSEAGVYEIIYRYYANGYVQDYKTDSFVVKDNFKSSDINLNFSYKSSKPTSATLGKETTLPQVKVFDKNNASVELEAYVKIEVTHIETGTKMPVKDYKFTPTLKGDYKVTYKASIPLFGLSTQESNFIIQDVKDNERPEWFVANNYTYTTTNGVTTINKVYNDLNKNNTIDTGEAVLYDSANYVNADEEERETALKNAIGNTKYNIPSVVVLNAQGKATVKIPAVYATDNYSDYSKLTFTRSVKSSTGLITEIKKVVNENGTETRVAYPANEWAEHTFTAAGDYTIRYEVKDEAGNYYMDGYNIKVLSSVDQLLDENSNYLVPTLNFSAIASYAKKNATLTINQPSATDKFDTRVETKVYYSFDKDTFDTANEITELNDEGKLVLELSDALVGNAAAEKIYIHAVAYNDYAQANANDLSYVPYAKITREVTLINTTDPSAPTFASAGTFYSGLVTKNNLSGSIDEYGFISGAPAFKQKDVVKLPNFVIEDAEDTNLNISVTVKNPYGKTVTVKNSSYVKTVERDVNKVITNNIYTVQNGTFTADYSGVYTITYTAKDAGGNIVSKSYGIRVQDTEKPTIVLSSYDPFTSAVEVGKFIEIPAATLTDKGEILTDITTNVPYDQRVDGVAGTYWELVEGPSLNTTGTVGFTPTVAGDYVIKYYGWDSAGNYTESKSYTITAQDSIKPTIELEKDHILTNVAWNEEDNQVTVYAPGVVQLYDGYRDSKNPANDYDQTSVSDITLTVKVYDKNSNEVTSVKATNHEINSDGTPVTDGSGNIKYFVIGEDASGNVTIDRYRFIAESQGTYTIKYIATDAAGNSTEVSQEVHVGDTDAPEVEWDDADEDLITTANIGDYYEFNLNMISLDGVEGVAAITTPTSQSEADYSVTVNLYDASSSVVTNEYKNDDDKKNSYRWKFEKSGTYELRIVATDKAGNKVTKSYNIVVAENETETETVKPVVGTILIVISALILVGVVAYFVITSQVKKGNKKGPKSKK